jgi:hypothetical protein
VLVFFLFSSSFLISFPQQPPKGPMWPRTTDCIAPRLLCCTPSRTFSTAIGEIAHNPLLLLCAPPWSSCDDGPSIVARRRPLALMWRRSLELVWWLFGGRVTAHPGSHVAAPHSGGPSEVVRRQPLMRGAHQTHGWIHRQKLHCDLLE